MRLLVLATAATLVLTGTAMAQDSVQPSGKGAKHHHYREANASVARDTSASAAVDSAPADTLSAHDTRVKNLHDSGYNPASDRDAAGNIRQY
jgi:hypothetical protein